MKTRLFFLLLLVQGLAFSGYAQIVKGSKMVGGTGFGQLDENLYLSLSPNVGFFVRDNLAVGSGLTFIYDHSEASRSMTWGAFPFLRYYLGQSATKVFATASFSFYRSDYYRKATPWQPEARSKGSRTSPRLGLGLTRLLTDQVGLEAVAGYYWLNYGNPSVAADNGFYLNLGFQIYLPGRGGQRKQQ